MNGRFLNRLKQKLQFGNTRSIHLNCLPGRLATRLDLFEFKYAEETLPNEFINNILNNPEFKLTISLLKKNQRGADEETKKRLSLVSKRLSSIKNENEDNYSEHGIKTFGFGFPLLIYRSKKDTDKVIKAPIFIWNLDIDRSAKNADVWEISRGEDFPIYLNPVLLNYLKHDTGIEELPDIPEDHLEDGLINEEELISVCSNQLKALNRECQGINPPIIIENIRDKEAIEKEANTPGLPLIKYSGILGLFRTPKEAIIKDLTNLVDKIGDFKFEDLVIERYQSVPYCSVDTDPNQNEVVQNVAKGKKIIIHGPPGTGKSQSLTAIITNALANNLKCLIVCEKRTALEVIEKNLKKINLSELCTIIEDVIRDRRKVVESVRNRIYAKKKRQRLYHETIQEADKIINKINKSHGFFDKDLLCQWKWTDLVGKYMHLSKTSSNISILRNNLKIKGLHFNYPEDTIEYTELVDTLNTSFQLFAGIKDNYNVLSNITDFFVDYQSNTEANILLNETLGHFRGTAEEVIIKGESLLNEYALNLTSYYEQHDKETKDLCALFKSTYDDLHNKYNSILLKNNIIIGKIIDALSYVSKYFKYLKSQKAILDEVTRKFNDIIRMKLFAQDICEINGRANYEAGLKHINSYCNAKNNWYSNIKDVIVKEVGSISSINYKSHIIQSDKISSFESYYVAFIDNLTKSKTVSHLLPPADALISAKVDGLKLFLNTIQELISSSSYFIEYFEWRSHCLNQSNAAKEIVDDLRKMNSPNWADDFSLWYIHNVLSNNENKSLIKMDDGAYATLKEKIEDIKEEQATEIINIWRGKQEHSKNKYESKSGYQIETLYNLRTNRAYASRIPLRKIIKTDFELFTDHFPVVLTNPSVCSSIFDLKEGLFDLVVFDEASQLRLEDTYTSLIRGKYKIVSGDEMQMPPSSYFAATNIALTPNDAENEEDDAGVVRENDVLDDLADAESLLAFATNYNFKDCWLSIHYRSRHPDLIEFSNAAFYGGRLHPMPPIKDYKAINIVQVNGIYDDEQGINDAEALTIINYLKELKPLENGEWPSIGIATFNIFQRDHIKNMIDLACFNDSAFSDKINKLRQIEKEELFVKNLENIQGDERDIIIISTTFGKKADGGFIQNFGPISRGKGFRLFNVIITRAKHNLCVYTSIPDNYWPSYREYISSKGNTGNGILYAYLSYIDAIVKGDAATKQSILELLKHNSQGPNFAVEMEYVTESIFEQEVVDLLAQRINPERIETQYKLGGFRIDIVVKSKKTNMPIIAIECDGAKYHSSEEAHAWDMFRQKHLEDYGLNFIRIWSTRWWQDTSREMNKLINHIEEIDKTS